MEFYGTYSQISGNRIAVSPDAFPCQQWAGSIVTKKLLIAFNTKKKKKRLIVTILC